MVRFIHLKQALEMLSLDLYLPFIRFCKAHDTCQQDDRRYPFLHV
jgi:hypothetical protein